MLSYQHAFHAGNHADILKHFVLSFALDSLNKKDKPYTFFDTHSGSGLYDLYDNRSLKTGEAQKGILSLLENLDKFDTQNKNGEEKSFSSGHSINNPDFDSYLNLVKNFTDKNYYPGSPLIEFSKMRSQDFLILSELHPQEIENLKKNIKKAGSENPNKNPEKIDNPSVQIHNRSGWEMLKALTPPKTKRGGVLIDPSYEEVADYSDAASTILTVHKKWSNGIILLWYPLLAHRSELIETMIEEITSGVKSQNENTEVLRLELTVNDKNAHKEVSLAQNATENENTPRLYGSGMLVINAPWKLKESAEAVIEYLQSVFYKK